MLASAAFLLALFAPGAGASSAMVGDRFPESARTATNQITAYTLAPDLARKAHHLEEISFWGQIATFLYSLAILLFILKSRCAVAFRDWGERASSNRFLQTAVFVPLLIGLIALFGLPVDVTEEWISRIYGFSVQSWPSWLWDWSKVQFLEILLGIVLVWILYAAIRRSPRRWWFYFWLASIPISAALVFVQPLIVDPMFHQFQPLAQKDPSLAAGLEQLVHRAGENIPPERMYWMNASDKTTDANAYVTGIGASKRIVVWDTTILHLNTQQAVSVVGHEMGHYVLNHIAKGLALGMVGLFFLFYLVYWSIGRLLAHRGTRWKIRAVDDLASLPAIMLLVTLFYFASNPIENGFSRHIEHQADQYGLELTHGLILDSGQVTAQSFQLLGQLGLEDPSPNAVDVFMFYTHPPMTERIQFAVTYDPWSHGGHGEFVP
jgi:STE24 endopeptidase